MRSGALRHSITVQRATGSLDGYGSPAFAWSDVVALRAAVIRQGTEEFLRGAGQIDERLVIFRTRYAAGIQPADRVLWNGAAYDIRAVVPDERERSMDLRTVAA